MSSRYAQHPLEANFREWESINQSINRAARQKYFRALRLAKEEFDNDDEYAEARDKLDEHEAFYSWINIKYGIKLHYIDQNISQDYDIVDEAKYTYFLLKFYA